MSINFLESLGQRMQAPTEVEPTAGFGSLHT